MTTLKKINKTYHIILYANLTTNTTNQSSNCTGYFDFGLLPKSRWKVKFYGCYGVAGFNNNNYAQVFADFGQKYNEFARDSSGKYISTQKQNQTYVGNIISYTNHGANPLNVACSFNIVASDNGFFYLDSTPSGSVINLFVYNLNQSALYNPTAATGLFCFAFEQLDDPIYRTIKNVYNVVFNSEYGVNNSTVDNSLGTKQYFFDWSQLPQGQYELTTSMLTSNDPTNVNNYSGFTIFSDFGQGNRTVFYPSNASRVRPRTNDFLSLVVLEDAYSIFPLVSYQDYTPPIFLDSRPNNNIVNLYINQTYYQQYYMSRPIGNDMNYTITFTFKWLGEKY